MKQIVKDKEGNVLDIKKYAKYYNDQIYTYIKGLYYNCIVCRGHNEYQCYYYYHDNRCVYIERFRDVYEYLDNSGFLDNCIILPVIYKWIKKYDDKGNLIYFKDRLGEKIYKYDENNRMIYFKFESFGIEYFYEYED